MKENLKIIGVIPAHLESIRFKRKILYDILGIPMVEHVRRRVVRSQILDDVFVATGDQEILNTILENGGRVIRTFKKHPNGTSRVAESINNKDCTHILIIQGDEPLIQYEHINNMVKAIKQNPDIDSWNATCELSKPENLEDKNIVKASLNNKNRILYCFRKSPSYCNIKDQLSYIKKIQGLIAFRKEVLIKICNLPSSKFEHLESIEQLKIIANGFNLYSVHQVSEVPSINEPKDLKNFFDYLESNKKESNITKEIINNRYE